MSIDTIYIPYFYIIQDTRTGMYYAGSKYGKDANPETFMIEGGYPTSSNTIVKIIEEFGLKTFILRKLKVFETGDEAYNYETRFLIKVNAAKNKNFYNKHNNDKGFKFGSPEFIEYMVNNYGVENASDLEYVKLKKKETTMRNYGVENPYNLPHIIEKRKNLNMEKYGVEYLLCNKEFQLKSKATTLERYGVNNPFNLPIAKLNRDIAMIKKFGTTCSLFDTAVREKCLSTMVERHGVKYASQIPEIKERKRKLQSEKSKRPNVTILKGYCKIFNIKELKSGWYLKSDEYLNNKIKEFKMIYGDL